MGTGALRRDQIVHIDGVEYRLLRMVSDSCWQLEQSNNLRLREIDTDDLLRMIVEKRLTFSRRINPLVVGPPILRFRMTLPRS